MIEGDLHLSFPMISTMTLIYPLANEEEWPPIDTAMNTSLIY